MGTKERRQRQLEDTREKILHAARDLFLERGYEEVTMRAIAQAIEYTPTAIYHHFDSKQDLVKELCHSDFGHLARHFLRAATIADPVERIRAIGEAYLDFAALYPNSYRFMFMTRFPLEEHMNAAAKCNDDPEVDAYAFLRRACEEAIQQNRLRPEIDDPQELAQILWGSLHGLISIDLLKTDQAPLRDLKTTARKTMDILFRGMLREREG